MTSTFRDQVNAALRANKAHNIINGLRKGSSGYQISNHAELVNAVPGLDKRAVARMIGNAKTGTLPKNPINRSVYVGPIRDALRLPQVTTILVPISRVATLRRLANMSDGGFIRFEKAIEAEMGKA